jgi:hypothetical protein
MSDPHGDLGALNPSWRVGLSPADVGMRTGNTRRAPGLRREELASPAGLSVDEVRLDKGRARRPSAQVVASLARALQLTDDERDHLFVVAGLLPPSPSEVPAHIPPSVQRLFARLGEIPLGRVWQKRRDSPSVSMGASRLRRRRLPVFTALWDQLSASPLCVALLGESVGPGPGRPNLLLAHFAGASMGAADYRIISRSGGVDAFGASLVADLRRVRGRYPDGRGVAALVEELPATSDRFRELWGSGAVGEHRSESKTIRTDIVGDLELDRDVLNVAGTDLHILVYTAAEGSAAADKLDFLRVTAVAAVTKAGMPRSSP